MLFAPDDTVWDTNVCTIFRSSWSLSEALLYLCMFIKFLVIVEPFGGESVMYICVFVKMLSIELVRTCAHARAHCGATSESIGTWILADIHGVALKAGA